MEGSTGLHVQPGFQRPVEALRMYVWSQHRLSPASRYTEAGASSVVIDVGFWSHRVDNYWHGDVHCLRKVKPQCGPKQGQMDRALLTAQKLPLLSEWAGRVWCLGGRAGRHPVTRPPSAFTVFSVGSGTKSCPLTAALAVCAILTSHIPL